MAWALFAQLLLEGNTASWASHDATQAGVTYEGRVIEWDRIERSIPATAGLAQHSNTRIKVADPDRVVRDLIGSYTFRRRTCKLYLAQSGGTPILSSEPVFTGEVFKIAFGETPVPYVELWLRDTLYGWMDEEFPALIDDTSFPEFGLTEPVFANVLYGHLVAADGQGKVPLQHIGLVGSPFKDRWVIACHEVHSVLAVYRRLPGEGSYTLVPQGSPFAWVVTEETRTVFGLDITFSFLDFIAQQADGTEIAIDVDGMNFRGAWGTLPALSSSSFSPPAPLRNPIDLYINTTFFFLAKSGRADITEIFDTDTISLLHSRCEPGGDNPALCDAAFLAPFTARQFHGQFLTSFEMFVHQQQSTVGNPGTLALGLLDDGTAGPSFTEAANILRGTFHEEVGDPSYNEILVHYCENYRSGAFECQELFVNDTEQNLIGSLDGSPLTVHPKAERETVELPFVTDAATAARSIARRLNFLSFGSYQQTFDLPLPGLATVLEPGKSAFLTHRMGIEFGGYNGREVKILGVSLDLGQLKASVTTILKDPLISLLRDDLIRVWYDIGGTGDLQKYRVQPVGTINGTNRVFVLSDTVIAGTEEIYVNGILQLPTDYTIAHTPSGTTITFTSAPQANPSWTDKIEVFYDVTGSGNTPRYWVIPSGAVNGVNTDFVLPETPITDSERVYVNQGLTMQIKGVGSPLVGDYFMLNPTTIRFISGVPQTGDTIYVFYDVAGARPRHRFRIIPSGQINGINKSFRLPDPANTNTERIFVNSVLQFPTADYSFTAADRIQFTTAPTRT